MSGQRHALAVHDVERPAGVEAPEPVPGGRRVELPLRIGWEDVEMQPPVLELPKFGGHAVGCKDMDRVAAVDELSVKREGVALQATCSRGERPLLDKESDVEQDRGRDC